MTLHCALTGLSICPGDVVRVALLTPNPYAVAGGGHAGEWHVRTPPLQLTCQDYGEFAWIPESKCRIDPELDRRAIAQLWLRGLRDDLVESAGFTRQADLQEIRPTLDQLAVGGLKIWQRFPDPGEADRALPVRAAAIREDAWQAALGLVQSIYLGAQGSNSLPSEVGSVRDVNGFLWFDVEAYRYTARRVWQVLHGRGRREPLTNLGDRKDGDSLRRLAYAMTTIPPLPREFLPGIRTLRNDFSGFTGLAEHLASYVLDQQAAPRYVLEQLGDLALICDVMYDARLPWRPSTPFGPRDRNRHGEAQLARIRHDLAIRAAQQDADIGDHASDPAPPPEMAEAIRRSRQGGAA